jgi:hypothetical protein
MRDVSPMPRRVRSVPMSLRSKYLAWSAAALQDQNYRTRDVDHTGESQSLCPVAGPHNSKNVIRVYDHVGCMLAHMEEEKRDNI